MMSYPCSIIIGQVGDYSLFLMGQIIEDVNVVFHFAHLKQSLVK